ncbi:YfhD family protein [Evansella tamaricis]|uniref:YfhD family protein n=1 Tax=Evansella tamaricis TaxID=2069301 RepID=A0ABS6JAP9_9BACI|nr:YfhD family protein [Evansella tamaricis]MBU9710751.1 YfhD family protein [Evansella tamaricis]
MAKQNNRRMEKQDIPDIPEDHQVEYSEELADIEDREAQARAKEADRRVNKDNI